MRCIAAAMDPMRVAMLRPRIMAMPPRVTEHDKTLMRCLRAEGMTLAEIAEKFECGIKTVSRACEGIQKRQEAA